MFSRFLSCSQMPVVFSLSVIHGLGFVICLTYYCLSSDKNCEDRLPSFKCADLMHDNHAFYITYTD